MASAQDIVFVALFAVVLVINIAGNSLVIHIITNERGMKTSTSYLLLNLAVADLSFGILLVPKYIFLPFFRDSMPDGILGEWLCKLLLNDIIAWMACKASLFTMICLSFERYFAVCRPHTFSQRFSSRNVKILVLASWVYSFLTVLPLFVDTHRSDPNSGNFCFMAVLHNKINSSFVVIEAVLSVLVMICLLVKITLSLWFKQAIEPTGQREITERKRKKKVTLCVLAVVVTFFVCWIPDYVMHLLEVFLPGFDETEYSIKMFTTLLMLINSALDPYLYSFQSSQFRMILKRVICCKKNP